MVYFRIAVVSVVGLLVVGYQNCSRAQFGNNQALELLRANNGYPYEGKIFVREDAQCPDRIRTRIRFFDSSTAVALRENCVDLLPPQSVVPGSFALDPKNAEVLIYQGVTLVADPLTSPRPPTVLMLAQPNLTGAVGDSIMITYQFLAEPMAKNYAMFVNFVNSSGVSVFFDNHNSPVPTDQWTGPQSDSRSVTIPSVPTGVYKIVVGLYEFNSVTGQYENQSLLSGDGVFVDGAPGNFQVGTLNIQ